jgi:hypothetical protein
MIINQQPTGNGDGVFTSFDDYRDGAETRWEA